MPTCPFTTPCLRLYLLGVLFGAGLLFAISAADKPAQRRNSPEGKADRSLNRALPPFVRFSSPGGRRFSFSPVLRPSSPLHPEKTCNQSPPPGF